MKFRIGCSGYYYPQWKNKFYPQGLPPKNWLAYYSSVFNTVELNGTFYRPPKLSDLKKYAQVTPDDFTFSVKMNRQITHIQRLKERQSILDFQDLIYEGLADKLAHFLFQMPPSFHANEENLERIHHHIPHQQHNVIELRHSSWWNDSLSEILRKAKITFCNIDFPGLPSLPFINTTADFYLRLHGNPELFITPYTSEQLYNYYHQLPKKTDVYTIYFNNTMYEAGYKNAMELMQIVRERKSEEEKQK